MKSALVPPALGAIDRMAAARRLELAESFLAGPTVQTRLGIDATTLTALREGKRLLGVWHEPIEGWLYPDFQFHGRALVEQMPAILATFDRYHSHVWANTWGIVEWFISAHALLDGHRPIDLLPVDPQRVLGVAQQEFWEDPATLW